MTPPTSEPRLAPVESLRRVAPYRVPRSTTPVRLALDGNEGVSPPSALLEGLRRVDPESLRRYPDAGALEVLLARRMQVDPAQVLVTAGADDALDRALRAVLAPGSELILPTPTFEMIERYARMTGADIVTVPWGAEPWPVERVSAAVNDRTRCIALVSPNNPTGLEASVEDLRRVAESAPGALVVVDQAYAEFGEVDFAAAVQETGNAVLVRSLSKAFGLAGLRVGYVVGSVDVVGWLRAAGQPFAVSGLSLACAQARLELGTEDVAIFVEAVRRERAELERVARELGLRPLRSRANFVFLRADDALGIWRRLGDRGIAVRAFPGKPGLEDALRITCPGDSNAFLALCEALREAVESSTSCGGGR